MNLASLYRPFGSFLRGLHPAQEQPVERDDTERLERIAIYARAGYFNMGYTLEMFHVIGEVGPE